MAACSADYDSPRRLPATSASHSPSVLLSPQLLLRAPVEDYSLGPAVLLSRPLLSAAAAAGKLPRQLPSPPHVTHFCQRYFSARSCFSRRIGAAAVDAVSLAHSSIINSSVSFQPTSLHSSVSFGHEQCL
eukprot:8173465-Pyramimonas_sp.AAC.1